MYTVADYLEMVDDRVRTRAYVHALHAAVRPGATVTEIGTGIGFFAVVACMAGAGRVFAVESDPAVFVAREIAHANGFGDRIECIHARSTDVELPPADVVCSDLRGVLPLHGHHLPTVIDARQRLLKPDGILVPARDTLWLALSETPAAQYATPSCRHGVDLEPAERINANIWRKTRTESSRLLSAPARWGAIDYRAVTETHLDGHAALDVQRDGVLRGIVAWFDAELGAGIGFSNAPDAPPAIYGQAFFPSAEPMRLGAGDRVQAEISARLVGDQYIWRWSIAVETGANAGKRLEQHSLRGVPLSPAALTKRADDFRPELGRAGEAELWMLSRMHGTASLGAIAHEAAARFPDVFAGFAQALATAGDLSVRLSR
jgi:type I protein arginine methyltransferase